MKFSKLINIKNLLFLFFSISSIALINGQVTESSISYGQVRFLGKSSPLKSIQSVQIDNEDSKKKYKAFKESLHAIPNFKNSGPFPKKEGSLPINGDNLLKKQNQTNLSMTPEFDIIFNVDGIKAEDAPGIAPPDCNGDIGLNYYLMATNSLNSAILHVFDKNNGEIVLKTTLGPLWAEIDKVGLGDPIIFFDRLENRWVLSEFRTQNAVLIAVSETEDPLGSYYIYEIETPTFPDYPKFGNWNDAWYLSTNEFQGFNPVYALDKKSMIAGEEDVNFIVFDEIDKIGVSGIIEFATPLDFSGKLAPPSSSNFAAFRLVDDDWTTEGDKIEYFEIIPDFENPENSTISAPIDLQTEAFELDMCPEFISQCIPQSSGKLLSVVPAIIMNKIQYRNFDLYESIVLNFTVDINGENEAGIRWMELRKTGNTNWETYQEGTFSLDDGTSRFMGSISQDSKGNIILGYSAAGVNLDPSAAFTARNIDDELGVMTYGENFLVVGEDPSIWSRWGDYFSMTLDPVDDETFWFTSAFVPKDEWWGTKLSAIKLRKDSIDVKANAFLSPISGDLNSNEVVSIKISNTGLTDVQGVNWAVEIDGSILEAGIHSELLEAETTVEITLDNVADFSQIGSYDCTLYVQLDGDINQGNDTIRTNIHHYIGNDMSSELSDLNQLFVCQDSSDFLGVFTNKGFNFISSYTANLELNGMLIQSNSISSGLNNFEKDTIQFQNIPLNSGENILKFYATEVNGLEDEDYSNDSTKTYLYYDEQFTQLNINFQSDGAASETSWKIFNEDNEVVIERGSYSGNLALEDLDLCLPEGCYTFILYDNFGDGWSTDENAFLEVKQENHLVLELTNLNFGSEWIAEFCVPNECSLEAEIEYQEESSTGANDASIIINFPMNNDNTMYSIDGGENFSSSPIFTNLSGGSYEIVVIYDPNCIYTESLDILTNTQSLSLGSPIIIKPNPNSGYFDVFIDFPNGPRYIEMSMMDQHGKIINNFKIPKFSNAYRKTIFTTDLLSGSYFLVVNNSHFHGIVKMIKI